MILITILLYSIYGTFIVQDFMSVVRFYKLDTNSLCSRLYFTVELPDLHPASRTLFKNSTKPNVQLLYPWFKIIDVWSLVPISGNIQQVFSAFLDRDPIAGKTEREASLIRSFIYRVLDLKEVLCVSATALHWVHSLTLTTRSRYLWSHATCVSEGVIAWASVILSVI